MSKEAMKLALEALITASGHVNNEAFVKVMMARDALVEALAEQPAQQEPVDFASLLREAEEIVREKPTWKRFIDGTPLANDIAVWMTVFAQDVARRASPPAQPSKPLTDDLRRETIDRAWNDYLRGEGDDSFSWYLSQAIEAAYGIKGDA